MVIDGLRKNGASFHADSSEYLPILPRTAVSTRANHSARNYKMQIGGVLNKHFAVYIPTSAAYKRGSRAVEIRTENSDQKKVEELAPTLARGATN